MAAEESSLEDTCLCMCECVCVCVYRNGSGGEFIRGHVECLNQALREEPPVRIYASISGSLFILL